VPRLLPSLPAAAPAGSAAAGARRVGSGSFPLQFPIAGIFAFPRFAFAALLGIFGRIGPARLIRSFAPDSAFISREFLLFFGI